VVTAVIPDKGDDYEVARLGFAAFVD